MCGIAGEFLTWRWYFWIGTATAVVVSIVSLLTIPRRVVAVNPVLPHLKPEMDWLGAMTIVPGLILIVYSLTDATNAPKGFATPYIFVTFVVGAVALGLAVYVEGWVAKFPLLPFALFPSELEHEPGLTDQDYQALRAGSLGYEEVVRAQAKRLFFKRPLPWVNQPVRLFARKDLLARK